MILVGNSFAKFAVCDQHLLLFLVDKVLMGLFMTISLWLADFNFLFSIFPSSFLCILIFFKILLKMVVVSQLDSVVSGDAEIFVANVIKLLGYSKVIAVNVSCVDHQEEKITRDLFILVQLLKYLNELSKSEEPLSFILS